MSLAFCIFGQLRDEHLSFPRIADIARANGAQVFLSVWDKRGTKTSGALAISQLRRIYGDEVAMAMPRSFYDRLYQAFPGLDQSINAATSSDVTEDDLRCYFPDAVIEIEGSSGLLDFIANAHSDRNSLRMLYKMWRCHLLLSRHERQTGTTFDTIALFRPDVVPMEAVPQASPNSLYFVDVKPGFVHDMFMMGDRASVRTLTSVFGACAMNAVRPWKGIHTELSDLLAEHDIVGRQIGIASTITEDYSVKAPIARSKLMAALDTGHIDPAFFPDRRVWPLLNRILHLADAVASHRLDGPVIDAAVGLYGQAAESPVALESLFSLYASMARARGDEATAFVAQTCRILAAESIDGLGLLHHIHFEEGMLAPWRHQLGGRGAADHLAACLREPAPSEIEPIAAILREWFSSTPTQQTQAVLATVEQRT